MDDRYPLFGDILLTAAGIKEQFIQAGFNAASSFRVQNN